MRRTGSIIAAFLLACAVANAAAAKGQDHYRWKDAQGVVHFEDSLPNEALQFGYDIVSETGRLVRHVPPPKTDAQLKAEAAAEAQKTAAENAATDQARADAQLLAVYPSETELVNVQKQQLAMLDQYIQISRISLKSQEESFAEDLSEAADLQRSGKPMPAELTRQIDSQRTAIEKQKAYIAAKQKEKADSVAKFAAELARYRQLRSMPAAQP